MCIIKVMKAFLYIIQLFLVKSLVKKSGGVWEILCVLIWVNGGGAGFKNGQNHPYVII